MYAAVVRACPFNAKPWSIIARAFGVLIAGLGVFSVVYCVGFDLIREYQLGLDTWPWPVWIRLLLLVVSALAAGWPVAILVMADLGRRRDLLAVLVVLVISLFGLLRFFAEAVFIMIELRAAPWS